MWKAVIGWFDEEESDALAVSLVTGISTLQSLAAGSPNSGGEGAGSRRLVVDRSPSALLGGAPSFRTCFFLYLPGTGDPRDTGLQCMAAPDIDLHLLRCLDALVSEGHVSRAAKRMGMSQSGMSAALARLRNVFGDPILLRTHHGMELSESALEIAGAARRALREIDQAVSRRGFFDPSKSAMTMNVMVSDYVGLVMLPQLMRRLSVDAPNIVLRVLPPQPHRIRESLANSEVDLVIGSFQDLAEGLYQTAVLHETFVAVARADHPLFRGSISLEEYAAADHAFYGLPPTLVSATELTLAAVLLPLGIERHIKAYLPMLSMIMMAVSKTDMLGTVPRRLMSGLGIGESLQMLTLPFEIPSVQVRTIWHERMHENAIHRWLRNLILEVGREL